MKNRRQNSKLATSKSGWLLILGAPAVTLYMQTNYADPINTPKLIMLILLAFSLSGALVESLKRSPLKMHSIDFWVLLVTLAFVTSLFISTLITKPRIVGFIGDTQRRNGFLAYLSLCVVFLCASRILNTLNLVRFYQIVIITCTLLSSYGLLQIYGMDFIEWNNVNNSMISTLGNPNFASSMLAILATLGLYGLALKELPNFFKILAIIAFTMSLSAIIYSGSRQGIIAILVSFIFYLVMFTFISKPRLAIYIFLPAFALIFFGIIGMLQKGPLQDFIYKNSVSVRGYYWRAGLEMFKNNFWHGVGIDRYGAYFKQFREVNYPLTYGYDITSSNAHNTFIQLFATGGVFVGLSYLAIVLLIFIMGIKSISKNTSNQQRFQLAGIFCSWIAFQAQSFISIDNIGISIWGWLLGGLVIGIAKNSLEIENKFLQVSNLKNNSKVEVSILQPLVTFTLLIPAIVLVVYLARFERETYILKSYENFKSTEYLQLKYKSVNTILNNPLTDPFYKYQAAISLYEAGQSDDAWNIMRNLYSQDPRNTEISRGYIVLAAERNDFKSLVEARVKLSKYDPWNAENYYQLLMLNLSIGNRKEAEFYRDRILSFADNTEIAKKSLEALA